MKFKSTRKKIGVLRVWPGNWQPRKIEYWGEKVENSVLTFRDDWTKD
jgi:hypothetical protein